MSIRTIFVLIAACIVVATLISRMLLQHATDHPKIAPEDKDPLSGSIETSRLLNLPATSDLKIASQEYDPVSGSLDKGSSYDMVMALRSLLENVDVHGALISRYVHAASFKGRQCAKGYQRRGKLTV